MKEAMCSVFMEYLDQLIYSINQVDWKEERQRKLMILMSNLEKQYNVSCFVMSKFKAMVDKELDNFDNGKICEEELMRRLIAIRNTKI